MNLTFNRRKKYIKKIKYSNIDSRSKKLVTNFSQFARPQSMLLGK